MSNVSAVSVCAVFFKRIPNTKSYSRNAPIRLSLSFPKEKTVFVPQIITSCCYCLCSLHLDEIWHTKKSVSLPSVTLKRQELIVVTVLFCVLFLQYTRLSQSERNLHTIKSRSLLQTRTTFFCDIYWVV